MGDLGSLLVGVAAIISSLASVGALVWSMRRGSDRESETAARIALETVHQPDNVTVIDEKRKPDGQAHEH